MRIMPCFQLISMLTPSYSIQNDKYSTMDTRLQTFSTKVWRVRQISGPLPTCGVADNDFQNSLSVIFLNLPLAVTQRVPSTPFISLTKVKLKSTYNPVLSIYSS